MTTLNKKFVRKPHLSYTPETTILPEPGDANLYEVDLGSPTVEAASLVDDTIYALKYELDRVQELQDALLAVLPGTPILVPENLQSDIGMSSVTISDYMAGYGSQEYGVVKMIELVESYHLNPDTGHPAFLYASILEGVKSDIENSLTSLTTTFLNSKPGAPAPVDYDIDDTTKAPTEYIQASRNATELATADAEGSRAIRERMIRSIRSYKADITKCLTQNLLNGNTQTRSDITKLLGVLRSIRSILRYSCVIYSVDWKSMSSYLRTQMASRLMAELMSRALQSYQSARSRMVDPITSYLKGHNPVSVCPSWDTMIDNLLQPMFDILRRQSQLLGDVYRYKMQKSSLQLSMTGRAPAALAFAQKYTPMLDAAISTIESLRDVGAVDSRALANILRQSNYKAQSNGFGSVIDVASIQLQAVELGIDTQTTVAEPFDLSPEQIDVDVDPTGIMRAELGLARYTELSNGLAELQEAVDASSTNDQMYSGFADEEGISYVA